MSRLDKLLAYQQRTRRIGHTTLMTEGINFERSAIMLFASYNHAQMAFREALDRHDVEQLKPDFAHLRIGNVRFKDISILDNMPELMRGMNPESMPAIVVDHFALQILTDEHTAENIWEGFNHAQEGDNGEYWSDCHPGGKKLTEVEKKALVLREVIDLKRY